MRKKIVTAVALTLGLGTGVAQATVLSDYLTFDGPAHYTTVAGATFQGGGEDKLQDDSLSKFVDVDGSGGYSVGDVIYGMVTLSDVAPSNASGQSITANQAALLFSAKIESLTGGAGGTIKLAAIGDSTSAYDLRNLLGVANTNTAGANDETVGIWVSTTTP